MCGKIVTFAWFSSLFLLYACGNEEKPKPVLCANEVALLEAATGTGFEILGDTVKTGQEWYDVYHILAKEGRCLRWNNETTEVADSSLPEDWIPKSDQVAYTWQDTLRSCRVLRIDRDSLGVAAPGEYLRMSLSPTFCSSSMVIRRLPYEEVRFHVPPSLTDSLYEKIKTDVRNLYEKNENRDSVYSHFMEASRDTMLYRGVRHSGPLVTILMRKNDPFRNCIPVVRTVVEGYMLYMKERSVEEYGKELCPLSGTQTETLRKQHPLNVRILVEKPDLIRKD